MSHDGHPQIDFGALRDEGTAPIAADDVEWQPEDASVDVRPVPGPPDNRRVHVPHAEDVCWWDATPAVTRRGESAAPAPTQKNDQR